MNPHRCIWIACMSLMATTTVSAQTGPRLLLTPWAQDTQSELEVDFTTLNRGHTDNRDARFHLRRHDVSGRWRQDPKANGSSLLAVGVDASYLSLSTNDPVLPKRLVNQAVAAGFQLNQEGNLKLVLGLGYAGNNPYADAEALYGQADLIYTKSLDSKSSLRVILSHNGRRVLFPDVPLPSVLYQRQHSETISYGLGFPINNVHWQVNDRLSVRALYVLPTTINLAVEYKFNDGWKAFGRFDNQLDAFTIDRAQDHRRLFFQQRRIEAGIRMHSDQQIDLTLAAGYTFGQEFSTGHDVRDLDDIAEPSDEPYFRVAIDIRF